MKIRNLVKGIFLVLVISLFACGKTENVSSANSDNNNKKTFTVGFDAEYPPYGYLDTDGTYKGFDLDLAEEVAKRQGWALVKKPIDWDSKDMELNSGSVDCIWNGFTVTGREDSYTWSVPYVDNSIVFVVRNDSNIYDKSDLAGKEVITQAGSSALSALNDEDNAENIQLRDSFSNLTLCQDYNTAFMYLESGMVDCIVVDIGVAKYQINNRKDLFRKLDTDLSKEQYAIGFKKGNTKLKDIVEKTVLEMYNDGTFMKIANNYADFSIPQMICLGK